MLFLGKLAVFSDFSVVVHEVQESLIVDVNALESDFLDDWGWDLVTRVEGALVSFVGEDVFSGKHNLCGSVLSWLGSSGGSDFAWEVLDHNEVTLLGSWGLNWFSVGGTGIGLFEVFVVTHV